jgi:hypothetical protein
MARNGQEVCLFIWLVVWNMAFMTFHILGIIIPSDELIFFRGVTTNQLFCFLLLFLLYH